MSRPRSIKETFGHQLIILAVSIVIFGVMLGLALLYGWLVPNAKNSGWPWVLGLINLAIQLIAVIWIYGDRDYRKTIFAHALTGAIALVPVVIFDLLGLGLFVGLVLSPVFGKEVAPQPQPLVWSAVSALSFMLITLPASFVATVEDLWAYWQGRESQAPQVRRIREKKFSWPKINWSDIKLPPLPKFLRGVLGQPSVRPQPVASDRSESLIRELELRIPSDRTESVQEFGTKEESYTGEVGLDQTFNGRVIEAYVFDVHDGSARMKKWLVLLSQVASVDEEILGNFRGDTDIQTAVAEIGPVWEIEMTSFKAVISITHMDTDGETFTSVQLKIQIFKK